MGLLGINGTGGNQEIPPASGKQKTESKQKIKFNLNSILSQVGQPADVYEVSKIETVFENGKKIETAYNSMGKAVKTSVFADKNGDGKFEHSEAVSVKFYDVLSKSCNTTEYKDTDNDGYYDEIIESDWTGNESIHKLNNKFKSEHLKMSNVYGSENDAYHNRNE